jgi:hypothetical protein
MNQRRATSLIELLIVMSACTVVLTLSAELIHRVMRAQSRSQAIANSQRSAQRLANAFRGDVHNTVRFETDSGSLGEGGLIKLTPTIGPAVEYRHKNRTIERVVIGEASDEESTNGEAEQSVTAREQFIFSSEVDVTVGQEEEAKLVTLSVKPLVDDRHGDEASLRSRAFEAPVYLEVQSTLGRTARFVRSAESEEGSR